MVDRQKAYLETTIISYYTGKPSRDIIIAGRQETTRESWDRISGEYERYISELVVNEISRGDPGYSKNRLASIEGIPVLGITDEAERLANGLIDGNAIAKEYPEDALHIALSSVNAIDFLLTWNFAHINNAQMKYRISQVVESFGYVCPVICTPDELIGV